VEIGTENLQHLKSAQPFLWPTSHPKRSLLERAQEQRLLGDYSQAIKTLNEIQQNNSADPAIALELQQVFMDQGYINRAMECYAEVLSLERKMNFDSLSSFSYEGIEGLRVTQPERDMYEGTAIARALLNLKFGYLRCFARGRWEVALHDAGEVFERYLRAWQPSAENMSLHVRLFQGFGALR
jgi:tetratricopeptide (TPR) repeat protein